MEHENEKNKSDEQKDSLIEKHVVPEKSKNIHDVRRSDLLEVIALGVLGGVGNVNQQKTESKQASQIKETYAKILTGCYLWWENIPKFVRGVLGWLIVIWPFIITFLAASGDNVINNIVDKIFPTKDTVEVICNIQSRDHSSDSNCESGSS